MAIIAGFFIDKFPNRRLLCILGMVLGTAVCYVFGTAWLAYQAGYSFAVALSNGVIPFLPGDCIKIVLAAILGPQIKIRLKKAGLI